MKRGILIVGGGLLQERAIVCGKKLGFEIHLVDGNSDCYCRNLVKNFYLVDCNNYKKVALIAKRLKKKKKNTWSIHSRSRLCCDSVLCCKKTQFYIGKFKFSNYM